METIAQRQVDDLLEKYGESHRHPTNEVLHCVCIPAIIFSFLGLLWSLHPIAAVAVTIMSLAYYVRLSVSFAFGMLVMSGVMLWMLSLMPQAHVLSVSLTVFVASWIGQFIGHKIEGKKPSFFEDLRFLLIGPLFVLAILYRRMHIAY